MLSALGLLRRASRPLSGTQAGKGVALRVVTAGGPPRRLPRQRDHHLRSPAATRAHGGIRRGHHSLQMPELRLFSLGCLISGILDSVAIDFPGVISCQDDEVQIGLSKELGNTSSWQVEILDANEAYMKKCDHGIDYVKQTLTAVYVNCTKWQHNKHHLKFKLQFNMGTNNSKDVIYDVDCNAVQADEASLPRSFASATNCTKDFMAVAISRLDSWSPDGYVTAESQEEWIVAMDDDTTSYTLSFKQAVQQGYTFLPHGHHIVVQVPFHAPGVVAYKQDNEVLYTAVLKLTYGPPEQRQTVEARMICAPGLATCNATHMMVVMPAFPGTLAGVSLDNKNIPLHQLQANGISVDIRRGVKLDINKRILKSRLYRDEDCSSFQAYALPLKLTFDYHDEMATMVTYPECPCDQNAPIAALCTRDGHMDFDIVSNSTKPALNLNTLQLKDPTCRPVFRSPSNDVVRFHVPLNGCETRQRFAGEKIIYENEVRALWADSPPYPISRDSEFRLTVICSYSSDEALLDVKISSLPSPEAVINQGPLSLILLVYPDETYVKPYSNEQYPIIKYLRQPIYLEVQVVNRNDPNIHLMLDNCWATLALDPASLPRWNIVVDGCDYELDSYKTVFHPVGPAVSYSNFRQRFEVKAFAFVSGGTALPSLVYFHCSVILCERFNAESPLCSPRCPPSSRNRRDVAQMANSSIVTLLHPVLLVPEEQLVTQEQQNAKEARITAALLTGVTLGLVGILMAMLLLLKIKGKVVLVN